MIIQRINEHSINVLKKNGWYQDRKYDISYWVGQLEREGYSINKYAAQILQNLGNLYIREKGSDDYVAATFNFNPYDSASGEFDRIEGYEKKVRIDCSLLERYKITYYMQENQKRFILGIGKIYIS